jgi:hypothetical protein
MKTKVRENFGSLYAGKLYAGKKATSLVLIPAAARELARLLLNGDRAGQRIVEVTAFRRRDGSARLTVTSPIK